MIDKNTKRAVEAAELERRAKQLRRDEIAFLKEADRRKDELLNRWNITTPEEFAIIKELSDKFGCTVDELLKYLQTDEQIIKPYTYDGDSDPGGDHVWP